MVQGFQTLSTATVTKVGEQTGVADAVGGLSLQVIKVSGQFTRGQFQQDDQRRHQQGGGPGGTAAAAASRRAKCRAAAPTSTSTTTPSTAPTSPSRPSAR